MLIPISEYLIVILVYSRQIAGRMKTCRQMRERVCEKLVLLMHAPIVFRCSDGTGHKVQAV